MYSTKDKTWNWEHDRKTVDMLWNWLQGHTQVMGHTRTWDLEALMETRKRMGNYRDTQGSWGHAGMICVMGEC